MTMSGCDKEVVRECTEPISLRVIKRLATAEKINPEDIPSYAQEIDFEALDTLIMQSSSEVTVCFKLEGYDVEVTSNGTIELD